MPEDSPEFPEVRASSFGEGGVGRSVELLEESLWHAVVEPRKD